MWRNLLLPARPKSRVDFFKSVSPTRSWAEYCRVNKIGLKSELPILGKENKAREQHTCPDRAYGAKIFADSPFIDPPAALCCC